jgi:diguanylate cyclase (GGDEF)-like protein
VELHFSASIRQMLSGDLAIFGGPAIVELPAAGRIRAEQISIIKRYLPWMMLANAFNALILVAALWQSPDKPLVLGWASLIIGFAALHTRKRGVASNPQSVSERAILRAVSNAFLLGSIWAALPVIFFESASSGGQLIITCLCTGMLAGGAFAFASIPMAAIAFMSPIFIGSGIAIAENDDRAYYLVAMLMVVYTSVLLRGVFVQAFGLVNRMLAQFKAEQEACTDPLTRLANRISFQKELERALARLARYGEHFAVLYVDVDDFKGVNDRLGHAVGDKLLMQMAERLRAAVRVVDTVARLGGDEFAIIAAGVSNPREALSVVERIIHAVGVPFVIHGLRFSKAVSIGIALAPSDGSDTDTLLNRADQAMYGAKAGASVQFFNRVHELCAPKALTA